MSFCMFCSNRQFFDLGQLNVSIVTSKSSRHLLVGLDESSVLKGRQAACDLGGGMGGELYGVVIKGFPIGNGPGLEYINWIFGVLNVIY